jgi:hypothetical protein
LRGTTGIGKSHGTRPLFLYLHTFFVQFGSKTMNAEPNPNTTIQNNSIISKPTSKNQKRHN